MIALLAQRLAFRQALRRIEGWLLPVLLVATIALCWYPSWWTITAMIVVVALGLLVWQRQAAQYDRARKELGRLRVRIADLHTMQGRFTANIAHEIKTPLAVVIGETDLLILRSEDAAAVRSLAASMAAEVRHLSGLVDSFLELAHPFGDEGTESHMPVFVGDLVISAVARCRELSKKLSVRMVTVLSVPDNGDPTAEVLGDPVLLEVMVENLLRNALRFSPPDAQVELTTHADFETVTIMVRDHGIGIPLEQQDAVFDWFFAGPGRPCKTMGTGFGLAIAKRVVDHHNGTITLRDTVNGGCEFEVTLPRLWPQTVSTVPGQKTTNSPSGAV